ncbi:MAG: hypothetical protein EBV05_05435 [Cyanobacteria bacterium WB6_1B_304]|jgi:hypothetical protein|nr:hypothetical protein [Cyanobacteria bacterium WB6_1B_304]
MKTSIILGLVTSFWVYPSFVWANSIPVASQAQLRQVNPSKPTVSKLTLDAGGVRVINTTTGNTRLVPFGMKENQAIPILTTLKGKPNQRGTNSECGAGSLGFSTWSDGLTLYFSNGRFAGWFVDGRKKNAQQLQTMAGVGVGSSATQLNQAYAVKIIQSSLGTEFSAGNLSGLLSGGKPTDRVTDMWSGTTCIFR